MSRNKCPACLGPLPKPGARPVASKPWRLSCFCPSAGVTGSRAIPSCARALGIRTQLLMLLQQALFSAASLQPHLGSFHCHLSCYQPPTPGASQTLLLRSWSQHHGHTTLPRPLPGLTFLPHQDGWSLLFSPPLCPPCPGIFSALLQRLQCHLITNRAVAHSGT